MPEAVQWLFTLKEPGLFSFSSVVSNYCYKVQGVITMYRPTFQTFTLNCKKTMHDTGNFTANKWRIFLLLIPVLWNSFVNTVQVFAEITRTLRGRQKQMDESKDLEDGTCECSRKSEITKDEMSFLKFSRMPFQTNWSKKSFTIWIQDVPLQKLLRNAYYFKTAW